LKSTQKSQQLPLSEFPQTLTRTFSLARIWWLEFLNNWSTQFHCPTSPPFIAPASRLLFVLFCAHQDRTTLLCDRNDLLAPLPLSDPFYHQINWFPPNPPGTVPVSMEKSPLFVARFRFIDREPMVISAVMGVPRSFFFHEAFTVQLHGSQCLPPWVGTPKTYVCVFFFRL